MRVVPPKFPQVLPLSLLTVLLTTQRSDCSLYLAVCLPAKTSDGTDCSQLRETPFLVGKLKYSFSLNALL